MNIRLRVAVVLAGALALVSGAALVGMQSADAASSTMTGHLWTDGGGLWACLSASNGHAAEQSVSSSGCGNSSKLKITYRNNYNGHRVISIQFLNSGQCLDSHAQRSGDVVTHACNNGNYQWLEAFPSGSPAKIPGTKSKRNSIVLKSIGAWEHQRVHICLDIRGDAGVPASWVTCNTNDGQQKFWLV